MAFNVGTLPYYNQPSGTPTGAVPGIGGGSPYGAVPGVYQASGTGIGIQGTGALNGATIGQPATASQPAQSPFGPVSFVNNTAATGGGAGFLPTSFQGVTYNSPQELAAAQNAYYTQQYNTNKGVQEQTHQQGLTSLDQADYNNSHSLQNLLGQYNPETGQGSVVQNFQNYLSALGQNRDQAYQSQAGYNSYVAPGATQSSQAQANEKIGGQYDRDLQGANTSHAQNIDNINTALGNAKFNTTLLGEQRQGLESGYQNNLQALQQALNGNRDVSANSLTNLQNTINQSALRNTQANTTTLDPVALAQDFKQYMATASQFGISPSQAQNLYMQKLNAPQSAQQQISPILQAVQGLPQTLTNGYTGG